MSLPCSCPATSLQAPRTDRQDGPQISTMQIVHSWTPLWEAPTASGTRAQCITSLRRTGR